MYESKEDHRLAWALGSRPIFHFFGKGVNRFSGPDRWSPRDSKGIGLVGNVADFSRCMEAGPESAWIENLETSW